MATAGKPLPQTTSSLRFDLATGEYDDGLSAFTPVRPRLFGIAYRMLGSAAEAEDIVTGRIGCGGSLPTGMRLRTRPHTWRRQPRDCVSTPFSPPTPAVKPTSGPGFPNLWTPAAIPRIGAERSEALKLAVLVLLEKLSPTERAAYVLREAFDYSYRQIADILQMEEANTRQLVSRARKHIADGRRASVSSDEQRRLLEAFISSAQNADMAALEGLFAQDVVSTSDGGGIVRAARVPVCGRERVAKFIATAAHFWNGVRLSWVEANGQAAVLVSRDGVPVAHHCRRIGARHGSDRVDPEA